VSATVLPRLLDRKQLAAELGVKTATAERIMRHCPKLTVGRRVFVTDKAVRDYLSSEAKS
jgi:hypothetical protein